MKLVLFSGVRGGVGTTSMVAMLADALCQFGQRVLAADLNGTDILRLHFNVPYDDPNGWLAASSPQQCLQHIFQLTPNLYVAPCGARGRLPDGDIVTATAAEPFWLTVMDLFADEFDWLLLDCPVRRFSSLDHLRARSVHDICVAWPDVAAHVLLMQQGLDSHTHLLINGLNPARQLAADVALDWRCRWGEQVLPVWAHEDEGLHESLAHKSPVTRYRGNAAASHTARSLALWCMAQDSGK